MEVNLAMSSLGGEVRSLGSETETGLFTDFVACSILN